MNHWTLLGLAMVCATLVLLTRACAQPSPAELTACADACESQGGMASMSSETGCVCRGETP